jgi:hypothetical protein
VAQRANAARIHDCLPGRRTAGTVPPVRFPNPCPASQENSGKSTDETGGFEQKIAGGVEQKVAKNAKKITKEEGRRKMNTSSDGCTRGKETLAGQLSFSGLSSWPFLRVLCDLLFNSPRVLL